MGTRTYKTAAGGNQDKQYRIYKYADGKIMYEERISQNGWKVLKRFMFNAKLYKWENEAL